MKHKLKAHSALNNLELVAEITILKELEPFLEIADWLLSESPFIVELSKEQEVTKVKNLQHMFLKQALSSLRAVIILILRGYTSQAATVSSSLFEIRLYSNYILDDESKAKEFLKHSNSQDFVWRPSKMIKHEAESNIRNIKNNKPIKLEEEIKMINSTYMFLCSLKHNNPIPLGHLIGAKDKIVGSVISDEEFPVMALPDTRESDLPTKGIILLTAINATFYVLRNTSITILNDSKEYKDWINNLFEYWYETIDKTNEYLPKLGPLPFPTIPK